MKIRRKYSQPVQQLMYAAQLVSVGVVGLLLQGCNDPRRSETPSLGIDAFTAPKVQAIDDALNKKPVSKKGTEPLKTRCDTVDTTRHGSKAFRDELDRSQEVLLVEADVPSWIYTTIDTANMSNPKRIDTVITSIASYESQLFQVIDAPGLKASFAIFDYELLIINPLYDITDVGLSFVTCDRSTIEQYVNFAAKFTGKTSTVKLPTAKKKSR